jgi:hypothetical protein
MGGREVRHDGDRPFDQLNCALVSSALVGDDPEKVKSVGMIRDFLQNLPVESLSPITPACSVMSESGLKVS